MKLETYFGYQLPAALALVRAALGEDAVIVHTRRATRDGRDGFEVVASSARYIDPMRDRLEGVSRSRGPEAPASPATPATTGAPGAAPPEAGPEVIALVGPTGAGKTTTAAKLAVHADAFGHRRVGFLALDTYRVAAIEQLQTYADIMGAPMEVAYHAGDIEPAMEALADCDVVIVDAPGRSPSHPSFLQWRVALRRTRPDEVHLVLPATIHPRAGGAHRAGYRDCGLTHLVVTKLDEMPDVECVLDLVDEVDLPVRWTTDGQDVPGDLRRGGAALLSTATRAADRARLRLVG